MDNAGTVNCTIGALAHLAPAAQVNIGVTVNGMPRILLDPVEVGQDGFDPNFANNTASAETIVQSDATPETGFGVDNHGYP